MHIFSGFFSAYLAITGVKISFVIVSTSLSKDVSTWTSTVLDPVGYDF